VKRILVSRTDRIGDLVLSTPLIETLKRSYPDSRISFLVNDKTEELLRNDPLVDEVICYRTRSFLSLLRRLREFQVAIVLYPTFTIAFLCWLSRIRLRVGTAYRFYSFFFNRKVYEHRKHCEIHEAEYNMNLLEPLGVERSRVKPRVCLTEVERDWARRTLREMGTKESIVALHPGGGGSSRRWSEESFGRLADALVDRGFEVLLTGGEGEEGLVGRVVSKMRSSPISMVGEASLLQLAALFTMCRALVTNSTGPMHLAASCGVPVVGIFCPISACSPRRWGPLGEKTRVVIPDVPACKRCTMSKCRYFDCMDRIDPEEVAGEVENLLEDLGEGES
jgi:heptosyltransferase-2